MQFEAIPTIPAGNIYKAAQVSSTRGDKALKNLSDQGIVTPLRTPTGRTLLSPADGKKVFEKLLQGA